MIRIKPIADNSSRFRGSYDKRAWNDRFVHWRGNTQIFRSFSKCSKSSPQNEVFIQLYEHMCVHPTLLLQMHLEKKWRLHFSLITLLNRKICMQFSRYGVNNYRKRKIDTWMLKQFGTLMSFGGATGNLRSIRFPIIKTAADDFYSSLNHCWISKRMNDKLVLWKGIVQSAAFYCREYSSFQFLQLDNLWCPWCTHTRQFSIYNEIYLIFYIYKSHPSGSGHTIIGPHYSSRAVVQAPSSWCGASTSCCNCQQFLGTLRVEKKQQQQKMIDPPSSCLLFWRQMMAGKNH